MAEHPLKAIGFWSSTRSPELPSPTQFVDKDWDPEERRAVVDHLRRGFVARAYMGRAECRVCGRLLGSLTLTDGTYAWPEQLEHYLLEHDVRLPEAFVTHVEAMEDANDERGIDMAWWIGAADQAG